MINFKKQVFGFDFDNTLDKPLYQFIAHYLKTIGKTIKVVTKRNENDLNDDLYKITDSLSIPRDYIIFTNKNPKSPYLILNDIQVFFDDDLDNIKEINTNTPEIETILVK